MNRDKLTGYTKIFITGILIVWLFIKSPLNPVYEGSNSGEIFSICFSFFYWTAVSSLLILTLFKVNRKNFGQHSDMIFCASVFLWYLFFIPYGYETTDTGYHLSKAWGMFHGKWQGNYDAIAGTNLIGGLWLSIFGKPFLLWARTGFVILQTLTAFYTYRILLLFFKPLKVFAVTLFAVCSISYFQYYLTINYDNLPYLFMVSAVYFALRGIFSDSGRSYDLILSGVLSFMAFFCKLTYIPALFLPPFIIFFQYYIMKDPNTLIRLKKYFFGLLAAFSAILIFSIITGGLSGYIEYFSEVLRDFLKEKDPLEKSTALRDHSFYTLAGTYFSALVFVLKNSAISLPVMLLCGFLISKFKNIRIIPVIILAGFGWLFYFRIFEPGGSRANLPEGILSFYTAAAALYLIIHRKQSSLNILLIIVSGIMFTISFMGSDLGITTAFRAGSGIFLISIISLAVFENDESRYFRLREIMFTALFLFAVLLVTKNYRPYRDLKFDEVQTSFSSPVLLGIKSNTERVGVIDSLLTFIEKNPGKIGNNAFYTKGNSLLYYLTDTTYPLKSPWDTINKFDDLVVELYTNKPVVIINSKSTHRDVLWPRSDVKWLNESEYENKALRYYQLYDLFIAKNNYVEVYANSFYTVYNLEKKGAENEE